ncbi:MAG: hypothetical protein DHS80DRAFT_28661 [Piptocephalis tieghemiana]|nr:MAG: hypothetical protein DHS80DRAFT_28661 [Piptocephalis tieghemiana]
MDEPNVWQEVAEAHSHPTSDQPSSPPFTRSPSPKDPAATKVLQASSSSSSSSSSFSPQYSSLNGRSSASYPDPSSPASPTESFPDLPESEPSRAAQEASAKSSSPRPSSPKGSTHTSPAPPSISASAPTPPPQEPARPEAFDFNKFLEQMRHRSAVPIARYVKSFLREFEKKNWSVNDQIRIIHDFLDFIAVKMRDCELWKGASEHEFENAQEGMEKLIMNRLYSFTFCNQSTDDMERDEIVHQKLQIFRWVEERHLDIPVTPHNRSYFEFAQTELLKINSYRAPRDKLICILNACIVIFGLLRHMEGPDAGADKFFPILIYVVLKSDVEQLVSNVQYISRFRDPTKLESEAGYYLTNLMGVISFLERMDSSSLSISQEEFDKNLGRTLDEISRERPLPSPRPATKGSPSSSSPSFSNHQSGSRRMGSGGGSGTLDDGSSIPGTASPPSNLHPSPSGSLRGSSVPGSSGTFPRRRNTIGAGGPDGQRYGRSESAPLSTHTSLNYPTSSTSAGTSALGGSPMEAPNGGGSSNSGSMMGIGSLLAPSASVSSVPSPLSNLVDKAAATLDRLFEGKVGPGSSSSSAATTTTSSSSSSPSPSQKVNSSLDQGSGPPEKRSFARDATPVNAETANAVASEVSGVVYPGSVAAKREVKRMSTTSASGWDVAYKTVRDMFPNVDPEVCEVVLKATAAHVPTAVERLLEIGGEDGPEPLEDEEDDSENHEPSMGSRSSSSPHSEVAKDHELSRDRGYISPLNSSNTGHPHEQRSSSSPSHDYNTHSSDR